jgi:hypothetical protein
LCPFTAEKAGCGKTPKKISAIFAMVAERRDEGTMSLAELKSK